jgi:hypothetical protein
MFGAQLLPDVQAEMRPAFSVAGPKTIKHKKTSMKCMIKRRLPIALAVAALIGLTAPTHAALVFFGEDLGPGEGPPGLLAWPNAAAAETSFLSNLSGVGTETFESFSVGTGAPLALNFPGAGTATLQGSGTIESGHNGFGRYPISGSKWWEAAGSFSINFSDPVAAFGFYGVDIGDFNGQVTLTLENGGVQVVNIPHTTGGAGGAVVFFGYINQAQPFTKATFGNTAPGFDFFGFDNMTIGSPNQVVPQVPDGGSTLLLLGFACAAIRFARKRLS